MPYLIGGGIFVLAGIGAWAFSSSAGTAAGTQAGSGLKDGLTIIGIASAVGIIIYAVHKSGGKK